MVHPMYKALKQIPNRNESWALGIILNVCLGYQKLILFYHMDISISSAPIFYSYNFVLIHIPPCLSFWDILFSVKDKNSGLSMIYRYMGSNQPGLEFNGAYPILRYTW